MSTNLQSPPTEASPYSQPTTVYRVQAGATRPAGQALRLLLLAGLLFVTGLFLNGFRLSENSDLKSDEATYVIESVALHQTGMTRWNGGPFFVHPPLFFMIEGLYFQARGIGYSPLFDRLVGKGYSAGQPLLPPDAPLTDDNMVNAISAGRYLSVVYGALITVLLFFLGSALLNTRLGLLSALLFMLDPYVLWRNHFNYLEPLTTLFSVGMIYAYYTGLNAVAPRQRMLRLLVAGVFFGLALLTKELAILYLPAFFLHWLLFRRARLGQIALPIGTGLALYALFPLWAAANGEFGNWWQTKTWLFSRLVGEIRDTGIGRPGTSIIDSLLRNLPDYWPWYLLLGVAALLAGLFLFLYVRYGLRDRPAEWLTALVIGSYSFFLVVRLMGGVINEQFFYLLMPIVALTVAYAALSWRRLGMIVTARRVATRTAPRLQAEPGIQRLDPVGATTSFEVIRTGRQQGPLVRIFIGALLVLATYNAAAWVLRYGLSQDNSYARVEADYLASTLPAGAAVVGRDLLDLYLLPKQAVYTFAYLNLTGQAIDPAKIINQRIPYTILNDQSLQEGFGGATPRYYNWVEQSGQELYRFAGRRYATSVYQLDYSRPLDIIGGGSLAIEHPAVASSTEDAAHLDAQAAFDGRITTRWASQEADNQWIYVDLGTRRSFSRVELNWEAAFAYSYDLQVSDDAQTWTTFYSTDAGAGGLEVIAQPATGRYVRLLLKQRATQYGFSLWEMVIYP